MTTQSYNIYSSLLITISIIICIIITYMILKYLYKKLMECINNRHIINDLQINELDDHSNYSV